MIETATIRQADHAWIFSIAARKGKVAVLADQARALFGANLPEGPVTVTAKGCRIVGTGPGSWLVFAQTDEAGSLPNILQSLKEGAAVCEQSGGYVVYDIIGEGAAQLMQNGVFVDLDLSVFPVGAAATTTLSHMGVTLWRTAPNGFAAAVFRSYAGAFEHWAMLNGASVQPA